ncbi:MAG TPA: hypothetical protein VM925_34635 [Labilithrix sp.]|nr:hypothetical protein [Labilithrix sp.]
MKCVLAFALFASMLACVPASEKRQPAGAAGFFTEPSAGARGEPFTTEDGWTVRFEKVVLQAFVSACHATEGGGSGYDGTGEYYLWNAEQREEIFVRALNVGPCGVNAALTGTFIGRNHDEHFDEVVNIDVSDEDATRFQHVSDDNAHNRNGYGSSSPQLLVVVRAEKAGRVVTFDIAFGSFVFVARGVRASVIVRADALTTVPLGVDPERLLTDQHDGSRLRFDPIANADSDGDGRVTVAELAAAPAIPGTDENTDGGRTDDRLGSLDRAGLLATLARRAGMVLVSR